MAREITITISEDGEITVEGSGLKPGEKIEDVAKFLVQDLANVTETGHKHSHSVTESIKQVNG